MTPLPLTLLALALITNPPQPHTRTPPPHHHKPTTKKLLPLATLPALGILLTNPTLTATATIIIATTTWAIHNHRTTKKHHQLLQAISDTITHTTAELTAGHNPPQALANATKKLPPTTPHTLTQALAPTTRLPHPTHHLTQHPHPHIRRLGTLLELATHHGIPPQPLLDAHRTTLDAHLNHHHTTNAELQGPKATAITLTLLPLAGLAIGHLMGAHPLHYLTHNHHGQLLLLAGTTLTSAGYITTTLIIRHASTP